MHKRLNKTQRNYIIIGLCMILVIMGVGYAAFSSQLKISGTSNITSNWSVKITNIESKVVSGAPTDAQKPSYTDTTATFKTRLTSPGDTMQYDVTVSNEGDIDAKLDKITVPESNNPAIGFEVSGIEEGSLLEAKQTAILTVTVKYNNVTEQPSDLTADLEVTLDYSQAPEGYVEPSVPTIGGQEVELVESGDGLYEDEYESGRLIYRGQNPNNYIMFNNELWRIIAKESDGTYKIVKNDLLDNRAWDTNNSNDWTRPATLNAYLNGEYYNSLDSSIKDNIVSHTWSIGAITINNNDLVTQINDENGVTWNDNIGLITVSEYLRANTNIEQCGTYNLNNDNFSTCNTTNWLYLNKGYGYHWWTISTSKSLSIKVCRVNYSGLLTDISPNVSSEGSGGANFLRPATYLSTDITLTGSGTESDPFQIVQ